MYIFSTENQKMCNTFDVVDGNKKDSITISLNISAQACLKHTDTDFSTDVDDLS